MSRQFKSTDTIPWEYGFGSGEYDATFSASADHGWDGATRFQAQGVIAGTAGQTSFTKPVGWGHTGLCLLHQTQGTGAGNWELAWVDFSGASAIADKPLQNSYTTGAQIITLSNGSTGYRDVTINGGVTLTAPAWNGSTGGILAILASGTVTIGGSIAAYGYNGGSVGSESGGNAATVVSNGGGFRGGRGTNHYPPGYNQSGEGNTGVSADILGNTGGNGAGAQDNTPGAGGGNGGSGQSIGNAVGGVVSGNASLTIATFGGGGSGGKAGNGAGGGGNGGGFIFIIAKNFTSTGSININGGAGGSGGTGRGGGGGAGGSMLLKCQTALLGTISAVGNSGGGGSEGSGGSGGTGRIHLDYLSSYSGSTSPAIDVTLDPTIAYPRREDSYSLLL